MIVMVTLSWCLFMIHVKLHVLSLFLPSTSVTVEVQFEHSSDAHLRLHLWVRFFCEEDLTQLKTSWSEPDESGDVLPHRSGTPAGWGCCGVEPERTKLSDCDTSHQPPYRSAESSPGQKQIPVTGETDQRLFNLSDFQRTQRRIYSI